MNVAENHVAVGRFVAMSPYALILVAMPLAFAAGAASWTLVERWFVERPTRKTLAVERSPDPTFALSPS